MRIYVHVNFSLDLRLIFIVNNLQTACLQWKIKNEKNCGHFFFFRYTSSSHHLFLSLTHLISIFVPKFGAKVIYSKRCVRNGH